MPIYVYRCEECKKEYEELQKMDAPKTIECGSCEGLAQRVICAPSIRTSSRDYGSKNRQRTGIIREEEPFTKENLARRLGLPDKNPGQD